MERSEAFIRNLLESANVEINGPNPWDIKVNNQNFYRKIISFGKLGLGESYMDEWWDCDDISELVYRILKAEIHKKVFPLKFIFPVLKGKMCNLQNIRKSSKDVGTHYNKGNELFKNMLDNRMTYSCGYWQNANNLDEAQEAKLDLVCKKVYLKDGMKILDIGCGWGSLLRYGCENYNVSGIGITLSEEQVKLGKEICKGFPIEIRLQDYREINEKFDRIVSIGMIEHVGHKNYRKFMKIIDKNLKDDGLFLLHTIGSNNSDICTDAWTNKYIFPNGMLPSIKQLAKAAEDIFVIEDWHNFGFDYSKTLNAWFKNFSKNWKDNLSHLYDDRFYRMWKYYLLSFAGSFRARYNQVWQVVFSKRGMENGYFSFR
ncbi:MAG: cyclopropane fatty acyl phospholipid synthase [Ignavibacteriae bacterium]|nr:cyclopropane fatty acyl phospholipid synthase [Ignavibacteriota bacterium]MCB9258229.1 cyclopropane fatty acyl phospholipid synthase [Ignavibacteriales bacterium]